MVKTAASAIAVLSLTLLATPAVAGDDFISGHAIAHDGTKIYFEVHGKGPKTLFLNSCPVRAPRPPGTEPSADSAKALNANRRAWLDAFTDSYRVILFEYPGEPMMYTLTPATVARDYLAIADAAGAETFAYSGFSWGCVTGLQLAIRTDRVEALVCGGFPAMDGPYDAMLEILRAGMQRAVSIYGIKPPFAPENARQYLTFYEALQSFDDRAIQGSLTMPRLNWLGSEDVPDLDGKPLANMSQIVIDNRKALEEAGWDVKIVPGHGHMSAIAPDVAVPLVREWLDANWKP